LVDTISAPYFYPELSTIVQTRCIRSQVNVATGYQWGGGYSCYSSWVKCYQL